MPKRFFAKVVLFFLKLLDRSIDPLLHPGSSGNTSQEEEMLQDVRSAQPTLRVY
jgi:hypothetical protein